MNGHRRFLYWGLFFVAMGGVLVAADLVSLDQSALVAALRLWPVVFIAIGVAILVRRTRYSLVAWLVTASLLGLGIGGALAAGPRLAVDCPGGGRQALLSQGGSFDGPARVSVNAGCGSLEVQTVPGAAWRLEPEGSGTPTATVAASSTSLTVDAGTQGAGFGTDTSQTWRLQLPTSPLDELSLSFNAGTAHLSLPGAQIGAFRATANAAETVIDLSGATVREMSAKTNLGAMSIHLPEAASLTGSLAVNLGQINVCFPANLGLRITQHHVIGQVSYEGFEQHNSTWQTPGYELAAQHADLDLDVNLGSIQFNPIGGCK